MDCVCNDDAGCVHGLGVGVRGLSSGESRMSVEKIDAIFPEARRSAEEWLRRPKNVPKIFTGDTDPFDVSRIVILLWETYLAICAIGTPQQKKKWIANVPVLWARQILRITPKNEDPCKN